MCTIGLRLFVSTVVASLLESSSNRWADTLVTLSNPSPPLPRSYNVSVPFSERVKRMFLEASTSICSNGSSSASPTNEGIIQLRAPLEWLIFLVFLPNQPSWDW